MNICYLKYDILSNNECTFLFYRKLSKIKNIIIPHIMTKINFDNYYERLVDENLGNILTIQRKWRKIKNSKREINHIIKFITTMLLEGINHQLFYTNTIIWLYSEYGLVNKELNDLVYCYKLFSNMANIIYNYHTSSPPYNAFLGYEYCLFDYWMHNQLRYDFFSYYNEYLNSYIRKINIIWQEWENLDLMYVTYIEWFPREIVEELTTYIIGQDKFLEPSYLLNKLPVPNNYSIGDDRCQYKKKIMIKKPKSSFKLKK